MSTENTTVDYKAKLIYIVGSDKPINNCFCRYCDNEWDRIMDELDPDGWMSRLSKFMVVCPDCGCKRCPRATYHDHGCTASNEPGQPLSVYGDFELDTTRMDSEETL
ncbi:hypothetical protein [Rhodococcus sp. 008]|uniref:hypothetical protein n=1 Tax=Rhodococcus sp. 008 TaxID=1723645 RepID=UPI0012E9FEC4|nr:hypothetical protein [Rhodococcus sp. 008]